MAEDKLNIKVVTPTRKIYEAEGVSVIGTSVEGQFELLPNHDPWMIALGMGELKISGAGDEKTMFFANGGFCQIDDNNVVILAEVCERCDEIDVERAEEAKHRAEERLAKGNSDETIDLLRAEASLKRALFRLDIADTLK